MTRKEKQRQRLIELLKQLFQLDQPDLDFGFYQIMHAQAETVTLFLEQDLLTIIQDSFGELDIELINRAQQKYQQTLEQARLFNLPDPEANSLVREARTDYEALLDKESNESEIYEHLYRFFERYYDDGDFMSRRYHVRESGSRAAPYAVPYDGQEVYLHWANRDQYYIKTTEHLANFSFDLANAPELQRGIIKQESLKLHCRIVAATEGEHNNNKTTDKSERFFIAHAAAPIVLEQDELVLQFEYRPDSEKSGTSNKWQERRLDEAEATILQALTETCGDNSPYCVLRSEIGADKRSLLRKYLNQYTKRNTTDYFIHKDLDSFLRRELDFYIKNEIMRLDDIENADAPRVENYLSRIRVLRKIAGHLISFLAQLENFQKKLWLKKKFVTDTQYCLSLDRIPEALYPEIATNATQREEWRKLFAIDELDGYSEPLSLDFLRANPFLVLDTAFFSSEFKDRLIASIADLDESLDGLLIHSENFQALGLMQEKYREQVKCTHIDPPYNTDTSGFLYKNSYQHSSWLAFMFDRYLSSLNLIKSNGAFVCHIDENEYERLSLLFNQNEGVNAGTLVWDKGAPVTGANGLATQHEYVIWRSKNNISIKTDKRNLDKMMLKAKSLFERYKGANKDCIAAWRSWLRATESLSKAETIYNLIDDKGRIYRSADMTATDKRSNEKFHIPLIHPLTNRPCPVPKNGWRYTPETLEKFLANDAILFGVDHTKIPRKKIFITENEKSQMPTVYKSGYRGKLVLEALSLEFPYAHSTEFYSYLLSGLDYHSDNLILDYFAGSGTTGHAVVNLNREDGGKRKYIMVEMGNYFDTVTRPRMQKVVYSHDWKDGKPISRDGISHALKYIRLESYEDTLNNLSFKVDEQAKERQRVLDGTSKQNFKRSYMLKYWLDFETQESQSLLNIEQFEDPTAYRLKIKQPDSEQYQNKTIDLVESFNWLIGLHVDHLGDWRSYSASFKREPDPELPNKHDTRLVLASDLQELASGRWQLRRIEGRIARTPGDMHNTDQVLVIWRRLSGNLEEDNAILDAWFEHYRASTELSKLDIVYVNGSNNLQRLSRKGERWQVQLIETAFHQQMWAVGK